MIGLVLVMLIIVVFSPAGKVHVTGRLEGPDGATSVKSHAQCTSVRLVNQGDLLHGRVHLDACLGSHSWARLAEDTDH